MAVQVNMVKRYVITRTFQLALVTIYHGQSELQKIVANEPEGLTPNELKHLRELLAEQEDLTQEFVRLKVRIFDSISKRKIFT